MVLGLISDVFASLLIDLFGFLLIFSQMCLIISFDCWERGLPLPGRSERSPLSLNCFSVFQTVDLPIESVFAILELDFLAQCNATIAALFSVIFKMAIKFPKIF